MVEHALKQVRVYELELNTAGYRILVDRLWPRGISREKLDLYSWAKNISPSTELRKWYGHDPEKFQVFKEKYFKELNENPEAKDFKSKVRKLLKENDVIFLYAAKDMEHNNAVVLKEWIKNI